MQVNDTKFTRAQAAHKQLLFNLKTTAETLFLNSKCGESLIHPEGLLRLHTSIEQIFTNGIRLFKPDNSPDVWRFIEGLNWLNPSMTMSIANRSSSPNIHIPYARIKNDKALCWIYENLKSHKLSQKLKYLVSDREHLTSCYEVTSFLQNQKYLEAFFLCLRAIENNQPNLLSQINSSLYNSKSADKTKHKRSTSHPDFSYVPKTKSEYNNTSLTTMGNKTSLPVDYDNQHDSCRSSANDVSATDIIHVEPSSHRVSKKLRKSKNKKTLNKQLVSLKLRPWGSLPDLQESSTPHRIRSKTISQPIHIPFQKIRLTAEVLAINNRQKVPSFSYKQITSDSGSSSNQQAASNNSSDKSRDLQPISLVKCDDIKIHFDRKHTSTNSEDYQQYTPSFTSNDTESLKKQSPSGLFSFLSSNKHITFNNTEKTESCSTYSNYVVGSVPGDFVNTFLPKQGEKIQNRYGKTIMEEVNSYQSPIIQNHRPKQGQSLTSFLQTAQFSRVSNDLERENAHFSVSEAMISAIEQIKWRNLEKLKVKQLIKAEEHRTGTRKKSKRRRRCLRNWDIEDKCQNIGTSVSSSDSSIESHFSVSDDSNNEESSFLQGLSVSTHSINDHAAYAEWGDNNLDTLSAESVALSLISKFSDKQLPRASDLLWLVSEQDAPQRMLPMPGSWTVSPDDTYKIPFTRGTRDWAPPRAQIIFTRHPQIDRKKLLHSQNQRCAGCGMKVAAAYSHRFRYCEYLGKYHCTGCHRNQISTIPARVLDKWDFTLHPVSVFSYRLLDQIWDFPLFRVSDLNKTLYSKIRSLRIAKLVRNQLKYIQDFIVSCRFANESKLVFANIPNHLSSDTDIWAMSDFVAVKNGSFLKNINALISKCEIHVFDCELCTARGFICEICPRKQVIFPWQPKIRRCIECGVCVHESCWKDDCAKCQRIRKRQHINVTKKN